MNADRLYGQQTRRWESMNILFLSQFFEPEPTLLTVPFVRRLAAMGHHIEVLTGFPNVPDGRIYPGWRQRWRRIETHPVNEAGEASDGNSGDPVRMIRVPLYADHSRSVWRRILNLGSFALSAATLGQTALTRPDVVFVYTLPTLGLASSLLKWFRGAKIVVGAFDLWPDSLFESGMLGRRRGLFERFVAGYCRRFYRRADRILVHSPGLIPILTERGIPAERLETFYLWCSEPEWTIPEPVTKPDSAPLTVVFTGNMGPMQDLGTVLDAAVTLQREGDAVRLRFVGGGAELPELKRRSETSGLKNVEFVPPVPMAEIPAIQASADAMLVTLRDLPIYRAAIPSKIQYAMYGGTPILCGVAGDATELVRHAGAGICFTPGDPTAIVAAVRELAAIPPDARHAMGDAGRRFYMKNLHSSIAAQRLASILERVVRQPVNER